MIRLLSTLAITLARAGANLLPASNVFDIAVDGHSYACDKYYDTHTRKGLLFDWWQQVNDLNNAALQALGGNHYTSDADTRMLARAMFGIIEGAGGQEPDSAHIDGMPEYARLSQAYRWYSQINDFLHTTTEDDERPKLFCGDSYQMFQQAHDIAKDPRTGQPRHPQQTLLDYEKSQGRGGDFYNWWWFWVDVPDDSVAGGRERSYDRVPRPRGQRKWPHGLDRQGRPNMCDGDHAVQGFVVNAKGPNQPWDLGRRRTPYLTLCTKNWAQRGKRAYKSNSLPSHQPALGMKLDDQDTNAHVLYHEIVHLVMPAKTPDFPLLGASRPDCWPRDRRCWAAADSDSTTFDGARSVALFDRADRGADRDFGRLQLEDMQTRWAVHSPENYYWFALGAYMQKRSTLQWASGKARPRDTPWRDMRPVFVEQRR